LTKLVPPPARNRGTTQEPPRQEAEYDAGRDRRRSNSREKVSQQRVKEEATIKAEPNDELTPCAPTTLDATPTTPTDHDHAVQAPPQSSNIAPSQSSTTSRSPIRTRSMKTVEPYQQERTKQSARRPLTQEALSTFVQKRLRHGGVASIHMKDGQVRLWKCSARSTTQGIWWAVLDACDDGGRVTPGAPRLIMPDLMEITDLDDLTGPTDIVEVTTHKVKKNKQDPLPLSAIDHLAQRACMASRQQSAPKNVKEFKALLRATRKTLPRPMWKAWAGVVKGALTDILRARSSTEKNTAMSKFLCLCIDYLPEHAKPDAVKASLDRRTPLAKKAPTEKPAAPLDNDFAAIKKCSTLANQGLLKKAAQALMPAKVCSLGDPQWRAVFEQKYPSPLEALKHTIRVQQHPPFEGAKVTELLRRQGNGASGGLTGFTKELLTAAIAADQSISHDLGSLLAMILSEEFSDDVLDIFRASKFIGLEKPDKVVAGQLQKDGRPIAAPCALGKLLGGLCFDADAPKLPTWQHGIGVKGACHSIVARLRTQLQRGRFLLTLDGSNAFNAASQAAIERRMEKFEKERPHLRQFFRLQYYRPITLIDASGAELLQTEGVKQGCLVSAWAFDDVIADPLEAAAATVTDAQLAAYQDDATLSTTTVEGIAALFSAARNQLATVGIALNVSKCEVICPRALSPHEELVLRRCEAKPCACRHACSHQTERLRIVEHNDCAKILGAPIGAPGSEDKQHQMATTIVNKSLPFLDAVTHILLNARLSYTLLAVCGAPKFAYLASITPPNVMRDLYDVVDKRSAAAFAKITGVPKDTETIFEDHGGQLPRYTVRGPALYSELMSAALDADTVATARHDEATLATMPQHDNGNGINPPSSSQPCCAESQLIAKAHQRSATGLHANRWLHYGDGRLHYMKSPDFQRAVQFRCGRIKFRAKTCTCGFDLQAGHDIKTATHLMTCDHNGANFRTRHDIVVTKTVEYLRDEWGFAIEREPTQFPDLESNEHKRPDFMDIAPRGDAAAVVDFTCVTATCSTYIKEEHPAAIAAQKKIDKHAHCVEELPGYKFFPLAVEAAGHFDPTTLQLIKHLADGRVEAHEYRRFRDDFVDVVSTAVQIGNGGIINAAVSRNDRAAAKTHASFML